MDNNMQQIHNIMMMVHQLCLLQKILQAIKTIGVHLLLMVGVRQMLELLLVPKQATGMQQLQPLLVQPPGDFVTSLFFLSLIQE
jgi:hypothetical protein